MLANHSEYIVDVLNGATEVEITCKRGGRRYTTSGLKLTPLVRCKECRYWKWIEWAKEYRCTLRNTAFNARADDYCSYGEREGE